MCGKSIPFIVAILLVIAFLAFTPGLVLFLPNALM